MYHSYEYKGLTIHKNVSKENGFSPYYTVLNKHRQDKNGKLLHAHTSSKSCAESIADCFNELERFGSCSRKYNLTVRNKAMRLGGNYIKMK